MCSLALFLRGVKSSSPWLLRQECWTEVLRELSATISDTFNLTEKRFRISKKATLQAEVDPHEAIEQNYFSCNNHDN